MNKQIFTSILFLLFTSFLVAQDRILETESEIITKYKTTINGKTFSYTATAGTQPVWNNDEKPIASLFYTYYKRSNINNDEKRPLLISFNGGLG